MAMLVDVSDNVTGIPRHAGAAGEPPSVAFGRKLMALAVGMVALCAVLAWRSLVALGLGRGWMQSRALKWKLGRFQILHGCTLRHMSAGTSFVLGFFGSSEPSADVGAAPVASDSALRHNIYSRCTPPSPSRGDIPSLHESDLKELISLINECDGGPSWQLMMERSNEALSYQAWFRDPPVGPTQCRTRTVFEDVSPELLKDFFWDDEFRTMWDTMLVYFKTLFVCPQTGTMVVHWIRKLPIIRSEKEYIIVRRIWESHSSFYCVTKAASCLTVPKSSTRRRIELYYSSWLIKPAKSRKSEQQTASEVLFFHWEDIGIPRELMKMGARAGMWRLVKRMHSGVHAYKNRSRSHSVSPSTYSLLARMTTEFELQPETNTVQPSEANSTSDRDKKRPKQGKEMNPMKWLAVGGLIIAAGLTLKANGRGVLCEVAKCLQMFRIRRKLQGRSRGEERIRR